MRSVRTQAFKAQFLALPKRVQALASKSYGLWKENASHPSLKFKRIDDEDDLWSIRIGDHYRAVCKKRELANESRYVWFWIGTHEEYNGLVS